MHQAVLSFASMTYAYPTYIYVYPKDKWKKIKKPNPKTKEKGIT